MPESDEDKVRRYTDCLMNGIDPKRALKRLYDLNVNPEVYKSSDTYKYVKRYESSPELAKYAKKVRDKLFGGRKRDRTGDGTGNELGSPKKVKKEEPNLDAEFAQAMKGRVSSHAPSAPRVAVDYSKYKVTKRAEVKLEPKVEPTDEHEHHASSSSTATSSIQSKQQKDYVPVHPIGKQQPQPKRAIPQSTSLHADENMFKPRKERQKVFAGRRKKVGEGVPSLVSMCQGVLVSNIDMIDHVGLVPFHLLEPALNQASTEQLRRIVDANPMLAEDADDLFHQLVAKEFPKYADREKDGWMWREMYDQLVEKKKNKEQEKLDRLTNKIGKAHTGQNQGRQTMVIDMAHTRVRSKSWFNTVKDTQIKMTPTPSAIQLSQARKNVKTEGKAQLRTITPRGGGVTTTSRSHSNNNTNGLVVKKTAPLMAKCKKMLRR
uniref:Elongin-A n=1 Tax=Caenorhabditis tropicalis TaxID=1561998 RepID=A0A1I7TS97_9PELO